METVLPDHITLHQEIIYNFEHMPYLLRPDKWKCFIVPKTQASKNITSNASYMITHIDYKTNELTCKINGEAFSIKIIYIIPDMIDKNLSTISNKGYGNEEMSELDFVRLIHCLIFSRGDKAKEVIEKVIDIFISSKMKYNHFIDLHLTLNTII